jgi:hypothetical protein
VQEIDGQEIDLSDHFHHAGDALYGKYELQI